VPHTLQTATKHAAAIWRLLLPSAAKCVCAWALLAAHWANVTLPALVRAITGFWAKVLPTTILALVKLVVLVGAVGALCGAVGALCGAVGVTGAFAPCVLPTLLPTLLLCIVQPPYIVQVFKGNLLYLLLALLPVTKQNLPYTGNNASVILKFIVSILQTLYCNTLTITKKVFFIASLFYLHTQMVCSLLHTQMVCSFYY
jgi:hypothetical protein